MCSVKVPHTTDSVDQTLRSLSYVVIHCYSMNNDRIKSLPGKRLERDLLRSLALFNIKRFKLVKLKKYFSSVV